MEEESKLSYQTDLKRFVWKLVIAWVFSGPNRSEVLVSYKRVLVHEFARPHSFANCFFVV